MKRSLALVLSLALLLAMTVSPVSVKAATSGKLAETLLVGVSYRSASNPYEKALSDGMDIFCAYLDSIGQKYEKQTLQCLDSSDKQLEDLKAFAARAKGNGIICVLTNEAAVCDALAEVCDETGIIMGTLWNRPDDTGPQFYNNWICHSSPDDEVAGYLISKTMFEKMGGEGKFVVVQGMLGTNAAALRFQGLQRAMKEYPNVQMVEDQTGDWGTAQALKLVETWLTKYEDLKGVWCANDNMAMGAVQALKAVGKNGKVAVVGIDAVADCVAMVESGDMAATFNVDPYGQAGYTLAIAYAAWTGEIVAKDLPLEKRDFATGGMLITSDNIQQYKKDYIESKPTYDFTQYWDFIAK